MSLYHEFSTGLIQTSFPLPAHIQTFVETRNWKALDDAFKEMSGPQGLLRNFLNDYLDYQGLEHIIAIRTAPEDEDGIWHDDGSRILGFSLSLTLESDKVEGGHLQFRKKGETIGESISTRPFGTILLFLTGIYGYEHRVTAVTSGERIVIAGWCQ